MKDRVNQILRTVLKQERANLLEPEAKRICNAYGIPTPRFKVVRSSTEAVKAARTVGFPVVLKIVSPDILHKTDVGCVVLGLNSACQVRDAFARITRNIKRARPNAEIHGVLIERMQPEGVEVIVGGTRDPQFGPAVMFGLGGILVELFEDFSFRLAPVEEGTARQMIREIQGYRVLKGFRGRGAVDEYGLVKILLAVSRLMVDHPEITEMDLNPTIVHEHGAVVVDARMSLKT